MVLTVDLCGVIILIVVMGTLFGLCSLLFVFNYSPVVATTDISIMMAFEEFLELENVVSNNTVFHSAYLNQSLEWCWQVHILV